MPLSDFPPSPHIPRDHPEDAFGGPGRAHPLCWVDDHYDHICAEPSGATCFENGCTEPAGTWWGPHWCPEHDAIRLNRISRQLRAIERTLAARREPPPADPEVGDGCR